MKHKYPEVVESARAYAENWGVPMVICQNRDCHWWNKIEKYNIYTQISFDVLIEIGTPLVRLLLIFPDGHVVQ